MVARLEPGIEPGIALRGEFADIVEWPVETHAGSWLDGARDMRKHLLDFRPRDDMHCVGVEDGIHGRNRPVVIIHIQSQWWKDVGKLHFIQPGLYAGQVLRQLAGLPFQVWQFAAKMHDMLSGTTGDLQYTLASCENLFQYGEDGNLVDFAGFGKRFHEFFLQIEYADSGRNFMHTPSIKIVEDISEIPATGWDALTEGNPILSHAYLYALQASGCTAVAFGWQAQHITLWQNDQLIGAMPLYVKMNSYGEHVFDFAWAQAYHRHGLHYYPKLLCAVPFTPATGPRLLVAPDMNGNEVRSTLLKHALQYAEDNGLSSLHCLFLNETDLQVAKGMDMMVRQDVQFHWHNAGYKSFDDYLAALSRDKRKRIKQERRKVRESGIKLRCITGDIATEADWAFFASCYMHTRQTRFSPPALNEDFFQRIGKSLPQHTLLVIAYREGRPIASAMNIVTRDVLYGRSWGAFEFHSGLHFEACYYQAIEFCIANGIKTFEGGAGGEHKLARGFLPVTTHSAHWLAHPRFAEAIENYLDRETDAISEYVDELNERSPFKRN